VIRATLYLGVVAALGALVVPRWIAPHAAVPLRGYFRAGFLAGVALLCIGTLAEAAQILARAAGAVDASLFVAYAFETRQGSIFALRIVVAALLVPIGLTAKRGGFDAAIVALGIAVQPDRACRRDRPSGARRGRSRPPDRDDGLGGDAALRRLAAAVERGVAGRIARRAI
jgi:hypothetical protein